jgi:riboflavin kinase / FMN adenylyltransferase
MNVYDSLNEFKKLDIAVVTTGMFDGVHLGHQKVLKKLVDSAKEIKGESVVITFNPHPKEVINPGNGVVQLLTTVEEKIDILSKIGIDHLIVIPFTIEFAMLSSEDFIEKIIIRSIGAKQMIIGDDHRFGKDRKGSFESLRGYENKYGLDMLQIKREDTGGKTISSSNIRDLVNAGFMEDIPDYLGRFYSFRGKVIKGNKLGRKIGFPTANVSISDKHKLIPKKGVYIVSILINGEKYKGMLNIGIRPTFKGKDIYGKEIEISLHKYIREEKKFRNIIELQTQLQKDQETAKKYFDDTSIVEVYKV